MKDNYDLSKGKRGSLLPTKGKTRITIFVDDDVLSAFRKKAETEGKGYQTLINETLTNTLKEDNAPVTLGMLKKVLKEQLAA